ncbi:prenyltransferase/squalene oxidase repeat-containing protein [Roseimaritima sediminicola]|uniref:prenyltransferase/squalene oxidase repeat-containing protein n=1 Tax=Roseimaritima sediminicola TaxID=2662066 RepID=UPI0012982B70|nr:prenyltransferase/squalene oxidase repeat-containing protein [Roseimaritima sediminicola]
MSKPPADQRYPATGRRPAVSEAGERMWPVDLALVALGGLVIYMAATQLRFDDPRWLYNAWTYIGLVAGGVLVSALVLHQLTGKVFKRSVEIGFLVSVFVHLLLLIVAVNVVIFSRYWPDPFSGTEPQRTPIERTVSEQVFQHHRPAEEQPDWAKPIEVETAAKEVPEQMRELPPMERTSVQLEMPTEVPQHQPELRPQLIQREQAAETMPSPDSQPSQLARRDAPVMPETNTPIDIPDVAPSQTVNDSARQRQDLRVQRARSASAALDVPTPQPQTQPTASEQQVQHRQQQQLPRLAMSAAAQPRRPSRTSEVLPPAGAAPTAPSVAVARRAAEATRLLRRESTVHSRATEALGSSLSELGQAGPAPPHSDLASSGAATGPPVPQTGMPQVSPGQTGGPAGRARQSRVNAPRLPTGPPSLAAAISGASAGSGTVDDAPARADSGGLARRTMDTPAAAAPVTGVPLPLDIAAVEGPAGLARRAVERAGLPGTPNMPHVAALDLGRTPLRRREVGGPIRPAGSQVAAVQSFERRVMRTAGSAAPAPDGMVGPQTEEAIERGLEFLERYQHEDGRWSLEHPGERVLLRSDTAATGLSLLAFQGAGYTHRQHQYASTVAKGLDFLLEHQKADGDLFLPEDAVSNRNVWLYSHGIAALALCEAYGMTQDPQLREPAQRSIDFIVASQHPTRGGWRYQPRNSSDTSVSGWMMMALKSGELAGLEVPDPTYEGVQQWLQAAQAGVGRADRYRYNPYAPVNAQQRHGRQPTRTMTAVGMLMRMYGGWRRDHPAMKSGADYLAQSLPAIGTPENPRRDTYYWYYATQVMFHMGGQHWQNWNQALNPTLIDSQVREGPNAGSWEPLGEVPDRWSVHAGRVYVTTMNLLSLEVFYRHLPIYEETGR